MRRLAVAAVLLVAACGGGTPRPASRIVFDCQQAAYEPKQVLVACGDGGLVLKQLRYSSWTADRAVAAGVAEANLCVPNCAQGHFSAFPATLVFDRPLPRKGHTILSRVTITYVGANPFGDRVETQSLLELDDLPSPAAS